MEAVDLGQSVPLIPLQVDPPDHRKYRRLLDPIFAPRRMNVLEPEITRMVNELIDGFIDGASAISPPTSRYRSLRRCSWPWWACPSRSWTPSSR